MQSIPKISVVIPTHQMEDRAFFLVRSFRALLSQSFKGFEVIVTDNSLDDVIENICKDSLWKELHIKYFRNDDSRPKGIAQNTNEAIKRATGELIKILYLDDRLHHEKSLQVIVDSFKGNWLATACIHDDGNCIYSPHTPSFSPEDGDNYVGSPSVITIKNEDPLLFDENMSWLLDLDYYKRLYNKYGMPVLCSDVNVCIGIHEGQLTNLLSDEEKRKEVSYLWKK